jgi:hypothetical protein
MRTAQLERMTMFANVKRLVAVAALATVAAGPAFGFAGTAARAAAGIKVGSHHLAINPQPLPPRDFEARV